MKDGESSLTEYKKDLPEEFWSDFEKIREILLSQLLDLMHTLAVSYQTHKDLSDKDLGLILFTLSDFERRFLFAFRQKGGMTMLKDARCKHGIFEFIRPDGNILPGYTPSYALKVFQEEVG